MIIDAQVGRHSRVTSLRIETENAIEEVFLTRLRGMIESGNIHVLTATDFDGDDITMYFGGEGD